MHRNRDFRAIDDIDMCAVDAELSRATRTRGPSSPEWFWLMELVYSSGPLPGLKSLMTGTATSMLQLGRGRCIGRPNLRASSCCGVSRAWLMPLELLSGSLGPTTLVVGSDGCDTHTSEEHRNDHQTRCGRTGLTLHPRGLARTAASDGLGEVTVRWTGWCVRDHRRWLVESGAGDGAVGVSR